MRRRPPKRCRKPELGTPSPARQAPGLARFGFYLNSVHLNGMDETSIWAI
jgi:hypothetical protein